MKKNNKLVAFICAAATAASGFTLSMPFNVYADATKVVSIGNDLTDAQKQTMLKYFGIEGDASVQKITVTNKDEVSHLSSYIPKEQIGTRTVSCAYIKPTETGGIRVRTANLQYVTANMIASTLADLGIKNCEVVSACPFPVSGTGALTGIIMAYETATGEEIDQTKKNIATQEVVVTKDLAKDIGNVQAEYVVNQAKAEAVQNGITNKDEIQNTVTNIVNNNNITISQDQINNITDLTQNIVNEDYGDTYIENITEINNNIKQEIVASDDIDIDVDVDTNDNEEDDLVPDDSITENLDESILGDNVITSSTDDASLIVETGGESNADSSDNSDTGNNAIIDETTTDETGNAYGDISSIDSSDSSDNSDNTNTTDNTENDDDMTPIDDISDDVDSNEVVEEPDEEPADNTDDSEKEENNGFIKEPGEEDGEGLEDIQLPEDGLSYYGYNVDDIKAASDENTAKRFIQLENNMKEAFPFSVDYMSDYTINEDKLYDDDGNEVNVDVNTLQSFFTMFTLSNFYSYIVDGSSSNLADYFKTQYEDVKDIYFKDYSNDEINQLKEILSNLKEPVRHENSINDTAAEAEADNSDASLNEITE